MNENPTIEVHKLQPITKFIYTIGALPTSYLMSMSYPEQLTWLCNYIMQTLIPALNSNVEAVQELQRLYEDLQQYVNDYFDNLDVQTEVNNKIDAMYEAGTLQEIITEYLQISGLLSYNSIAEMKSATNLINGSKCETLGYYSANDGGASKYSVREITNEDVVDDMFIIALSDENLVAELVIDSPLNVLKIGVKNDGSTDISEKINIATQKENLYFPTGTYLVENEIEVVNSIIGENFIRRIGSNINGTLFQSNITCDYTDREELAVFNINNSRRDLNIVNIGILLHDYECGIKGENLGSSGTSRSFYIDKVGVNNVKSTGIYITGTISRGAYLNNITCFGTSESFENSRGIYVSLPDSKITNVEIMACRIGCQFGGFVQGSNYHIWCGSLQGGDGVLNHTTDESWFKGTRGIIANQCLFDNIYIDTAYYKITSSGTTNLSAKSISNLKCLDDTSMDTVPSLTGRNFYNWGGILANHVNHITKVNLNSPFSTDINYVNESIILHVPEADYLALNNPGSTRYYDVNYTFNKIMGGVSNTLIEVAKIKATSGNAGIINFKLMHLNNRAYDVTLRFSNGSYTGGTIDKNGQSDEKLYITTSKDGSNIYTLYLSPNSRSDEYIGVSALKNPSRIQLIDLSYRFEDGTGFVPAVITGTTGLTEITSA